LELPSDENLSDSLSVLISLSPEGASLLTSADCENRGQILVRRWADQAAPKIVGDSITY